MFAFPLELYCKEKITTYFRVIKIQTQQIKFYPSIAKISYRLSLKLNIWKLSLQTYKKDKNKTKS